MIFLYSKNHLPYESLTVPAEAVRGLRYKNRKWLIYASDPEPMAVSMFSVHPETLEAAAYYIQDRPRPGEEKPLKPEDAKALLEWLLGQPFIKVDLEEADGSPSMFPSFPTSGPGPRLGMKPPSMDR
jgi:hypothetical protein